MAKFCGRGHVVSNILSGPSSFWPRGAHLASGFELSAGKVAQVVFDTGTTSIPCRPQLRLTRLLPQGRLVSGP